jgi:uncharacterized protein YgiM (DUF1202 family)
MGLKLRRLITWAGFLSVLLAALATLPGQASTVSAQHLAQVGTAAAPITGATAIPKHRINIWAGPGRGFWHLGAVTPSEQLPITGRTADSQFWQVSTRFGVGYVWYLEVDVANAGAVPVVDTSNVGAITAGIVAIRGGDGIGSLQLGRMSRGQQFFVIGMRTDGTWLNIRWRFGKGWVKTSLTNFTVAGASAVAPDVAGPRAIVNAGALNVRTGPGLGFTSLGTVRGGTVLPIIGRSEGGVWLQVQSPFGVGWVNVIHVITRDYFNSAPIAVATDAVAEARLRILGGSAHVRSGPGIGFDVLYDLNAGMEATIIGQSKNGWWYINSVLGKGWVNKTLGEATGALSSVPFLQ